MHWGAARNGHAVPHIDHHGQPLDGRDLPCIQRLGRFGIDFIGNLITGHQRDGFRQCQPRTLLACEICGFSPGRQYRQTVRGFARWVNPAVQPAPRAAASASLSTSSTDWYMWGSSLPKLTRSLITHSLDGRAHHTKQCRCMHSAAPIPPSKKSRLCGSCS